MIKFKRVRVSDLGQFTSAAVDSLITPNPFEFLLIAM